MIQNGVINIVLLNNINTSKKSLDIVQRYLKIHKHVSIEIKALERRQEDLIRFFIPFRRNR